ncbi:MAG: hypothetical protein FWC41_02780 [Firmicutes bacterium]|nr:hypothetical protein [Bacillota bacterium]
MISIINGKQIKKKLLRKDIIFIKKNVEDVFNKIYLSPEEIIDSLDKFVKDLKHSEIKELYDCLLFEGLTEIYAKNMLKSTIDGFRKDYINKRLYVEFLGYPFVNKKINDYIEEKFVPLGILIHITSSNSPNNPILSLLDGLITGNINIIKMPSSPSSFSEKLICMLVEKRKELTPYIYLLKLSSSQQDFLKDIILLSDCVVVWGSDRAVKGIKELTSHKKKIVSWGHRISFAYVSYNFKYDKKILKLICKDICVTNQLACNAPQCIFVDVKNRKELLIFSNTFASCMKEISPEYPLTNLDVHEQSEITTQVMLAKAGQVLGKKFVIEDDEKNWRIIVDYESKLKFSPLFRTVLIMPVKKNKIADCILHLREYLQTAVVCCNKNELFEIQDILIRSGVTRICLPGESHCSYIGEPHDGKYPLREYVNRIRLIRTQKNN